VAALETTVIDGPITAGEDGLSGALFFDIDISATGDGTHLM
jgi:hypothetical protein